MDRGATKTRKEGGGGGKKLIVDPKSRRGKSIKSGLKGRIQITTQNGISKQVRE